MRVGYQPNSIHDLEEYGSTQVNVTVRFPQKEFESEDVNQYYLDVKLVPKLRQLLNDSRINAYFAVRLP